MKTELALLLLISLACHGEFSETDPSAGSLRSRAGTDEGSRTQPSTAQSALSMGIGAEYVLDIGA